MKNKILIVDKDQLILYGLSKALRHESYDVETAHSAATAIDKLTACPYDLCLLDMNLPDFNGMELMHIIKDICPKNKIVIMTASSIDCPELNEYVEEALQNGACHFILKPFNLSEVLDTLNQLLQEGADFHTGLRFTGGTFVKKARKSRRRPCSDEVRFQMMFIDQGEAKRWNFEATSIDISDHGIGLLTRQPLKASQVIGFDEELGNKNGVVIWSTMLDDRNCRAGIRFA